MGTIHLQHSIIRAVLGAGILLLIPLALQLTIGTGVDGQGFNWTPGDFIAMGALIFIAGLALDLALKRAGKHKAVLAMAIVIAFLLAWAHLAVGIVDSWPFAGS